MEKKKRKYDIHSTVRVPNIDEIQNAAADFSEEVIMDPAEATAKRAVHFPTVNSKPQFDAELSSIKKEMQKLAVAVAKEEKVKEPHEKSLEEIYETSEVVIEGAPKNDVIPVIPQEELDAKKAKSKKKTNPPK